MLDSVAYTVRGFLAFASFDTYSPISNTLTTLVAIFTLVIILLQVLSLLNVSKGKEANFPVLATWAYKAMGCLPQPPAPAYPQPGQQPPYYGDQQPPAAPPAGLYGSPCSAGKAAAAASQCLNYTIV